MKKIYKLIILLFLINPLLAKADLFVTIVSPGANARSDSSVNISVDILTVGPVDTARATISGRSVNLMYNAVSKRYEGNINLVGLPEGKLKLTVYVANAVGELKTVEQPIFRDSPPKVNLVSPVNAESYTTKLHIKATVSDVGSNAVEGYITVDDCTGACFRFINSIDTLIDVYPTVRDWASSVYITAIDSAGQRKNITCRRI
jgi:hypothetical protein